MTMDARAILAERLDAVRGRIAAACRRAGRNPGEVTLVAVTKSVNTEVAAMALELGMLDLAENRPQELWRKAAAIPTARWHLVGHLQRNKIDRTIPLVSLVHSVDSERLLDALDGLARRRGQPVPILLEVNCSREEAKGGFPVESIPALADSLPALGGVSVRGLMTLAAYSDDPEDARQSFAELRRLRDELRTRSGLELPHLSMGMSGDFEVSIEEGATLVRIGTTLFNGLGA
jgi:pyridoxal phosphate enzyme (YggS family)